MRKIKKLLMTFGIAGALAIGVGATVATQNSNPEKVDAAGENISYATYNITAKNAVSSKGAPTGTSAKFVTTYNSNKFQLTKNNSQTLTLTGYDGYVIDSLEMLMHSNGSSGKGSLTFKVGGVKDNVNSFGSCGFNDPKWNGEYTTTNTSIVKSGLNIEIGTGENFEVVIACTSNSLYNEMFKIGYYKQEVRESTNVTIRNGETLTITSGTLNDKLFSHQLIADVTYATGNPDTTVVWSTDSAIASIDKDGYMTFTENGTAVFKATSGNQYDYITVTATNLVQKTSVTKSVEELANELGWATGSSYTSFALNNFINVKLTGANSGEYSIHNKTTHQLHCDAGNIVISAIEGYQIDSVSLTYYSGKTTNIKNPDATLHNSGSTYTATSVSNSLIFTCDPFAKLQSITVSYKQNDSLFSNNVTVEFAQGKTGQYLASNLKDNAFATEDLKVLVKCNDILMNTIESGVGYKLTITNGTKTISLDATNAPVEQKFYEFEPGDYTLTVSYINSKGTTLTSAGITLKVLPLATDTITITKQPKLEYASFFEKYTEFEGGAIEAVRNDTSKTSTLSDFAFQYIVNGLEKQLSDITDVNGYFTFTEPTDITVNAYLKEFGSTSKAATYNVKVTPATTITATNADQDTVYYTNVEYPMSANVTTVINGITYNIPASDITITPATLNVPTAGQQTITVSYNKIPTVSTTFTVDVVAPKGTPTEFLYYGETFNFTAGDKFSVPALNPYASVTYENDPTTYDVTTLDNIRFYLSLNDTFEEELDIELTDSRVMEFYDNNYQIIPVYTEGITSIASLSVPLNVNEKSLPTYKEAVAGKFTKVTDMTNIHDGAKLIIAGAKGTTLYGLGKQSGNYRVATKISAIDNVIDTSTNAVVVTLIAKETTSGTKGYALYTGDGYLSTTGSGNDVSTVQKVNDNAIFEISVGSTGFVAKAVDSTASKKTLQFNSSSTRFSCYADTQEDLLFYVELDGQAATDPADFIIELIDTMRLNAYEYVEGQGNSVCDLLKDAKFKTQWDKAKELYKANSSDTIFMEKLSALDKYADGETTYAQTIQHLMAIDPTNSINPLNSAFDNQTGTIMLIVGLSIVGITSIVAFSLLSSKKKSKQN